MKHRSSYHLCWEYKRCNKTTHVNFLIKPDNPFPFIHKTSTQTMALIYATHTRVWVNDTSSTAHYYGKLSVREFIVATIANVDGTGASSEVSCNNLLVAAMNDERSGVSVTATQTHALSPRPQSVRRMRRSFKHRIRRCSADFVRWSPLASRKRKLGHAIVLLASYLLATMWREPRVI